MALIDGLTLETLALWSLSALGVYHLVYVANTTLRRTLYRAQDLRKPSSQLRLAYLANRALRRMQYRAQDVRDPSNQLRLVMAADFSRRKVMELSEYRVFQIVEDEVSNHRGHRVFAQTSLGEILKSNDRRAYSSINSKRVDILVIAPDGYPLLAVEYQGDGHYQNGAAARDAVKKEALRKAGVQYLEISKSHSHEEIRGLVRSALGRAPSPPSRPIPTGPVSELAAR